jgi:EmrB/QacA subfamily drug resistance transporter
VLRSPRGGKWLVLVTVCLAAFTINLDTTIVNVALPSLASSLHATTSDLQWVVDGYNLAFAALVLAGGSIADRFGRRPALLLGLTGFAVASVFAAYSGSSGELIGARLAMGLCAALVYPATLSVITATFRDRKERAVAIGVWGAVTGMGVALGPVTGGLLLVHLWSGSVFLALVPVAIVAAGLVVIAVPPSREPEAARLDPAGLLASIAMLAALVFTVIEAPSAGWLAARTLGGLAASAALLVVFVAIERRRALPMLDVSLFSNPRFSAASGAVTVSFFALFGFIFLITQYFQLVKGYSTLQAGVRTLPVAGAIAAASILGTKAAVRYGTRVVVTTGLLLFATALLWISTASAGTTYATIAGQMIIMGAGLGLTSAPATESIMSVLTPEKAGIGSAMNDATREVGGTLGVAIIGSIFTSLFGPRVIEHFASLPEPARQAASKSVGAAAQLSAGSRSLTDGFHEAFMTGLHAGCWAAAGVCLAGALATAVFLPRRGSVLASGAEAPLPATKELVLDA